MTTWIMKQYTNFKTPTHFVYLKIYHVKINTNYENTKD